MVLRTLLIPKGRKKEMKRRKTRQHKSRKGEERKSSRQLNETLLAKIATTVTLMDKIKMKFIH